MTREELIAHLLMAGFVNDANWVCNDASVSFDYDYCFDSGLLCTYVRFFNDDKWVIYSRSDITLPIKERMEAVADGCSNEFDRCWIAVKKEMVKLNG